MLVLCLLLSMISHDIDFTFNEEIALAGFRSVRYRKPAYKKDFVSD